MRRNVRRIHREINIEAVGIRSTASQSHKNQKNMEGTAAIEYSANGRTKCRKAAFLDELRRFYDAAVDAVSGVLFFAAPTDDKHSTSDDIDRTTATTVEVPPTKRLSPSPPPPPRSGKDNNLVPPRFSDFPTPPSARRAPIDSFLAPHSLFKIFVLFSIFCLLFNSKGRSGPDHCGQHCCCCHNKRKDSR